MNRLLRSTCFAIALILAPALSCTPPKERVAARPESSSIKYPHTRTVDQVDEIHGEKVADPYRWLEDENAEATKEWVQAQNRVTFGYLETIPCREGLKQRLTALWDYEKYGIPHQEGGRYFFSKNDGLQNQSVLYVADPLDGEPRVLLDPNKLSADGTISLSTYSISPNGKLMAYGLADGGSDWQTYHVRNVDSGEDLGDKVQWVKFTTASWSKNNSGFFYSRYPAPDAGAALSGANYYQKLYYHRMGTPQSQDALIYERPDQKDWGFAGYVTDDGQYLIITVWQGTDPKKRVYYKSLVAEAAPVVKLLDDFDAAYNFIDNDGPVFWFHTDLDAPKYRVIAIDTRMPERAQWREVIPETADTLQSVNLVGNRFICEYLKDARTQVRLYNYDKQAIGEIELPGIGTAYGFGGKRREKETFYAYNDFARPPTVYRYDIPSGRSEVFREPRVGFDPAEYVTTQVFYSSKDGTQVPMFITHKRGLRHDGRSPCYLYGYGGFNISLTPRFSIPNLVWMEMGGIYAQANLRGGGEYGRAWHDAGRLKNKQNVFDDFISAAEWLIANEYTCREKLAIGGGSNGGLLVGACITQRPDLFGAALPAVGVLDMLRFAEKTIGHAWKSDYGDVSDPEIFRVLRAYSPYHNVKPGTAYPATLVTTGDHDDRVVPAHSFKFAAALQAAHTGADPVLIRIETRAGHGAGKPTQYQIEEAADRWAFLVEALDLDVSRLVGAAKSPATH